MHSLRAQADKDKYSRIMRETLENQENLDIKQTEIVNILTEGGRVTGVENFSGMSFFPAKP